MDKSEKRGADFEVDPICFLLIECLVGGNALPTKKFKVTNSKKNLKNIFTKLKLIFVLNGAVYGTEEI